MDKFVVKEIRESHDSVVGQVIADIHLIAGCGECKLDSNECLKGRRDYIKQDESKERMKREKSCDFFGTSAKHACLNKGLPEHTLEVCPHNWRSINAQNLNLRYTRIFSKQSADFIFRKLEDEVEYFSGDLLKVKVFGKWHNIPRKQVSYGDSGLSYTFSGTCVPAVPWSKCKIIMELKKLVESVSGHSFNFVLVNRYKDGADHMGEHRDDEKDLVASAPIASLSFGQARDFIFKHKDARGKKSAIEIDPVKIELEHGSLLLMEWPTNKFWYHSLPVRKKAINKAAVNTGVISIVQKEKIVSLDSKKEGVSSPLLGRPTVVLQAECQLVVPLGDIDIKVFFLL